MQSNTSCPGILTRELIVGRVGENAYRTHKFDVSPWLEEYPGGTVSIVYKRTDGQIRPPAGRGDRRQNAHHNRIRRAIHRRHGPRASPSCAGLGGGRDKGRRKSGDCDGKNAVHRRQWQLVCMEL